MQSIGPIRSPLGLSIYQQVVRGLGEWHNHAACRWLTWPRFGIIMAPLLRGYLMERKKLNVRLPADLHEDLAEVAAQYDLSMNTVAVLAVRNYVGYVASTGRLPGTHPTNKGTAKKRKPSVQERPGRNEKCHCGSGKKYKVCCYPD